VTEPSPYDMALAQYDRAVKHLSVRRGIEAYLRVPRRELTVNCPVKMDDGSVRIFTGASLDRPGGDQGRDPLTILGIHPQGGQGDEGT